jgi:hypothetical protein
MSDSDRLSSELAALRDEVRSAREQQSEALALQREQFALARQQFEREGGFLDRSEARQAAARSASRRLVAFVGLLVVVLFGLMAWRVWLEIRDHGRPSVVDRPPR